MTLGPRHLVVVLPLFAAAMVYNIWYFTQGGNSPPSRPVGAAPAFESASGPSVAGESAVIADPAQIPPVPGVALDRLPQWRRNPFVSTRQAAPSPDAPIVEAVVPAPEMDIVIEAIVTSADRPARARVNGETVRVGDRIGTATVVEIQPKAIVIDSPTEGRKTIVAQRRSTSR